MIYALQPSLSFYLCALCTAFLILPRAFCADLVYPPNNELVNATDARIQYDPPMSDSTVWSFLSIPGQNTTAVQTSHSQANASFVFQGTSITLSAVGGPSFPKLLITLDDRQFSISNFQRHQQKEVTVPLNADGSELDFSVNHTVVIQKTPDANDDTVWNILALSFTPSSSSPSPVISSLPITSLPTPSDNQTSSSKASADMSTSQHSDKLSDGAIAGTVIGSLLGVCLVGFFSVCLRRRHRQKVDVAPEPLVISPSAPRHDRSRFRRLYSDRLPHFTAPPSIWPTSGVRTSLSPVPPLPIARESLHAKITPFTLPTLAPQILTPSPPKQRKPRRPRYSSFFIANPSSHSSRSARSQSLTNQRIRSERVPAKETGPPLFEPSVPTPWVDYVDEKKELKGQQETTCLEKGKQRAVDFEIDPTPIPHPTQSRMTRAQSLRRFFFTTNPNPSTSSGSSTTSSKQFRSSKRAAVADYVRAQMHHKPQAECHPNSTTLPLTVPASTPLPRAAVPEQAVSPVLGLPAQPTLPAQSLPIRSRQSQTLFFTTNPSPSTQDLSSERAERESVLSEIPPPRKDKGKGRAF